MSEHDIPRDAALSQLYREAATAEPAPHLDAAILAAARGEAARTPQARPRTRWRGWLVPVSVAAVAVLSLTLTLQVPRDMEQAEREAGASVPPARPVPGGMSAPAAERAAPAAADAAAPAASDMTRFMPPAASSRRQERAPAGASKPRAASSAERAVESREAFVPEPPSAVGAVQSQAESAAPGAASEAPAAFEARPPPAPAKASATPSPAAGAAFKAAPAVPDSAQEVRKRLAPPTTADEAMPKKEVQPRAPAEWLEDVRARLRQGRVNEAETELAAFRRAYPDYVLPEDLRALPLR